MPIVIEWPSVLAERAEVWRILDLSGMTKSVRESRNFTKAGFVYVDGNLVFSLNKTVEIGSPFTLELRFPRGKSISQELVVVTRPTGRQHPRQTGPRVFNRKG